MYKDIFKRIIEASQTESLTFFWCRYIKTFGCTKMVGINRCIF